MRIWVILAGLLLSACQHVSAPPQVVGEIRDLRSGQVLTAEQLLARLSRPERVLIGEQHDNADHHAAQDDDADDAPDQRAVLVFPGDREVAEDQRQERREIARHGDEHGR